MKSQPSDSPADRMLDELLREQAHGPDQAFLDQIEAALDAGPAKVAPPPPPARRHRPIAVAAGIGIAAGLAFVLHLQNLKSQQPHGGLLTERQKGPQPSREAPAQLANSNRTEIVDRSGLVPRAPLAPGGPQETNRISALSAASERPILPEGESMHAQGPLAGQTTPLGSGTMDRPSSGLGGGRGAGSGSGVGRGYGLRSEKIAPAPTSIVADAARGDQYGRVIDPAWKVTASDPLSTFSIDVDTASYSNVRRMILEGRPVPTDAVRIEECINAFSYHYAAPRGDAPFAVGATLAPCPWAPDHSLVRIALKGREIESGKRPASNLVFLIDVSGSMASADKLPLLKQSMLTLVDGLDERDRVAIVVYAGSEGVALPSTALDAAGKEAIRQALGRLEAGGSTNGGAGITRAYELAMSGKVAGGVNRVILATDGDFNVGITGRESLVDLVKSKAAGGVYLTVLGFGSGNLNDAMMDAITRDGNGNYFYVDSEQEGRKVFGKNLTGTLVTIAKDVKIQVEFNPARVGRYRLVGYSNRVLRNEDFSNDKVDAGDIGAGHTVTAFYEIAPPGGEAPPLKYQAAPALAAASDEWLTVSLRYKHPEGTESSKVGFALAGQAARPELADAECRFATAVVLFGMKLRGAEETATVSWQTVLDLATPALATDVDGQRAEFIGLVQKLAGLPAGPKAAPAQIEN